MISFSATLYLFSVLVSVHALGAEQIPSPDGQFTLVKSEAMNSGGEYQLQRATLKHSEDIVWEYASQSRGLQFSWSPDSRHYLFAQSNGARDVSLFLVFIDDDRSPRLREIDLVAVHEVIIAKNPKFYERPGGSMPVSYIEWPNIRWVTPSKCELRFFDKSTGLDSEARIQLDFEKEQSKVTVLSITDKIEKSKNEVAKP